jgi:6,7-dimethyl-8-ribityllumazine synthase
LVSISCRAIRHEDYLHGDSRKQNRGSALHDFHGDFYTHTGEKLSMKTELKREEINVSGLRFAIVTARWNDEFTSKLRDGALQALSESGVATADVELFGVPGAFELPLAAKAAASQGKFAAVVALGVVIRGDTPHFDYVAGQAAAGIMQASLETGVPILFGVITADTREQVVARSGEKADNKGYEAALSAIEMADVMRKLS